jgi:hypothetical protein
VDHGARLHQNALLMRASSSPVKVLSPDLRDACTFRLLFTSTMGRLSKKEDPESRDFHSERTARHCSHMPPSLSPAFEWRSKDEEMIKAFDNIGEIFQGIEQWVLNSVNLLKATWSPVSLSRDLYVSSTQCGAETTGD